MNNKILVTIAKVLLALVLAGAGIAKLMGMPEVHKSFAVMGLPIWFGYLIGVSETVAAVMLFFPKTRQLALTISSVILIGATYYHVSYTPIMEALTAVISLLLCWFIYQFDKKHSHQAN